MRDKDDLEEFGLDKAERVGEPVALEDQLDLGSCVANFDFASAEYRTLYRALAKQTSFGISAGAGPKKLLEKWRKSYPEVDAYLKQIEDLAYGKR